MTLGYCSLRGLSLQHEACVHPIGQVQRTATASVRDHQVNEPAALGDFYIESPWFLGESHDWALGCQMAVDVHVKLHAGVGREESSILMLPERVVVHASPCHKPVIAWLDLIQKVGRGPHTHAPVINGFADAKRVAGECQVGLRLPYPIWPRAFEWFELIEVNVRVWRHRSEADEIPFAHSGYETPVFEGCGMQPCRFRYVQRLGV